MLFRSSKLVKENFTQIKNSGRFQLSPLPLFDGLGGLVPPCDYVRTLSGALVALDVVLSYEDEGFVADVDHIQVLRGPLPLELSLTKRRMAHEKALTNHGREIV